MPGHGDPQDLTLVRIRFQDPDTGETADVALDPVVFVALVHLTRTFGNAHAVALLQFAAALVKPELTPLDHLRLEHVLVAVERYIAQWSDPVELTLAMSYEQLREQKLTNEQVAAFAAALLDQEVSSVDWRTRVDVWSDQQGLPPLEPSAQGRLFELDASDCAPPRTGESCRPPWSERPVASITRDASTLCREGDGVAWTDGVGSRHTRLSSHCASALHPAQ